MSAAASNPLRVGVIGTGAISQAHRDGFIAAGARIVAIADISETALAVRSSEWNVDKAYTDFRELIEDDEVEAVTIAAPNAVHHPAVMAAAKAGKHVLCEKPISLNLELAREMIDACRDAGVILQVNHQLRSSGAASYVKRLIESGELGDITFMRFRQAHDWSGATTVRGVFGSLEHSGGGTLLDNGTHMMDLARFFAGPVAEVYAKMATLKYDIEVEDVAATTLQFRSGALATVESSWSGTGWEEAFWVWGTKGAVEYTNRYGKPYVRHAFRDSPGTTWGEVDLARIEFAGAPNHTRHILNFVAAVRGERDVICTGEDGLKAVRLVLAAYESARKNAPVAIPSDDPTAVAADD